MIARTHSFVLADGFLPSTRTGNNLSMGETASTRYRCDLSDLYIADYKHVATHKSNVEGQGHSGQLGYSGELVDESSYV
jgi:hypothetical protein